MSATELEPVIVTAKREDSSESSFPQGFSLESVKIETDFGQVFDVRNLVMELCFYEDMYSFVTSGYMILKDAIGVVENFKLDGNEFIKIKYGSNKTEDDSHKLDRTFRIYKVGNRNPIGNLNSEFLTLYFCNEILLLSEQIKVSKGYTGKKISTRNDNSGIINNILTEKLRVDPKRIVDIEESYGVYDFVVPRLKPLEAISWLSTYARPSGDKLGADMVFFETKDGFKFKSLQSLMEQEPYTTYKYQLKNLPKEKTDSNEISVLSYEIVKSFDALESTNVGLYANKLISIDPITKRYKTTTFNYDNYAKVKGQNPVVASSSNRFDIEQTKAFDSRIKVVFGNSNEAEIQYIKERQGSVAKDIFIENNVPYRTAQIALANYTILKMLIPGDSALSVGMTINFNLYTLQNTESRQLDEYYSGKYLVTALRHVIQTNGTYQIVAEIAKESVNNTYVKPDSTSASYKQDRKE